jgi:integral membrane protein
MPETKIGQFRVVAKLEGISFLILLFIAMPLKYMMGIPEATKIVGMIHGGLFLWFLYAQFVASQDEKWGTKFNILAFIASIIPFGTFYLDKKLRLIEAK